MPSPHGRSPLLGVASHQPDTPVVRRGLAGPNVAYVGNFGAAQTTESYVAEALGHNGRTVFRHQENHADFATLAARIEADDCPLVFWTRTPAYGCDTDAQRQFVGDCAARGIVTVGLHLDRYFDLAREPEIAGQPWWRQSVIYTADGGNQDRFAEAGVTHRWWRPAVSASQCGRGLFNPALEAPLAFVGSHRYHPEWPWRPKMLRHLQRVYGSRFAQYGRSGERLEDHQLADAYASVAVIVGDSCLANRGEKYWSNRLVETVGRGGFLVHPHVEGIDDHYADGEHLAYYEVGDLAGLVTLIDRWIDDPEGRHRVSQAGMERVIERDTFEVRMAEVLADLGQDHPHLRSPAALLAVHARNDVDRVVIREQFPEDCYRLGSTSLAGRVVLDVGANIGAFAVHAASLGARVIAIEPDPVNFAVLTDVADDSGYDIALVNAAVAATRRGGTMVGSGPTARFQPGPSGAVEARPLDFWLADYDDIAILKLDVECGEYAIVEAATMLDRCERIEIEWHGAGMAEGADGTQIAGLVLKLLETHTVEVCGLPDVGGALHAWRR